MVIAFISLIFYHTRKMFTQTLIEASLKIKRKLGNISNYLRLIKFKFRFLLNRKSVKPVLACKLSNFDQI